MMISLWQDLRYGARMLSKKPGFTLIAVLTLALGIGVNTAILSTVNAIILRPLPVPHPEEVMRMFMGSRRSLSVWGSFSYPDYVDIRDQNRVFSGLVAKQGLSSAISDSANPEGDDRKPAEAIWGEAVSGNYFDVLGVRLVLGRTFLPEENRTPGTHPVVVLGHALWQRRYNSDPSIIGKTTYLNSHPFTIIGVAPPSFEGVSGFVRIWFWIPMMMEGQFGTVFGCLTERGGRATGECRNLELLGRLKSGATMEQARADLNLIAENLERLYPNTNTDFTNIQVLSEIRGRLGDIYEPYKFTSMIALAVAGLVLLVACANIANLLLARAGARSREIGIRLAIGAGRLRIVRQLLVESSLLAGLGGALGLLFTFWLTDLIKAAFPPAHVPLNLDFSPDLSVLKWMLLVTLMTGVIFGLAPAIIASRTDLISVMKGLPMGPGQLQQGKLGRLNLRNLLVFTQLAFSIIILICASLFLRSLSRAQNVDPGFNAENLITMQIGPGLLGYSEADGKRFFSELLHRIESQPGVQTASLLLHLPLGGNFQRSGPIFREGDPSPRAHEYQPFWTNVIGPKYFETLGTPLLMGREFTERDNKDAPRVAIVNQEFVRRLYGSEQNVLGKRFRHGEDTPPIEIIGVAKDGRYTEIYESPLPYFFLHKDQEEGYQYRMVLLVRAIATTDSRTVIESVRRELSKIDSRIPIIWLQLGEQNLANAYYLFRLGAGLGTALGLLVLVLSTMGLYSVMTYMVSHRTHEIGIRMALGAKERDVLKMVVRQGLILVIGGMIIGLIGALALTRLLSSLLFGITTTDPLSFTSASLLLALVALLACWIPARRATRVDPIIALRHE